MYGVIALFDEKTEQIIKDIWRELSEKSISFYAEEIEDRRPHITIASYENLNYLEYSDHMELFYVDKSEIEITFQTLGTFLNSGTLFFSPTVTKELLEFHSQHHQYFKEFNDNPNSLYLPGKWIPHCTLANRLSTNKLSEAFHYCLTRNDTIHGKIKEVAIIEVTNKNIAPQIYSKVLKKSH
ncbi:2'-5' RNA ligase [Bacillus pakistanensis]|uniref:2'-5' RNA ligase n=1 Tax=Rossellomorea pakistanensis TaxID=992288 RepID=A0ABS2NI41_9BACI|nr:2'-5' RNA ligase family protein [Bacillus pakistanensis]MBM7587493.1 2'-5' RNA ligase [Bacillus pakistanensis]